MQFHDLATPWASPSTTPRDYSPLHLVFLLRSWYDGTMTEIVNPERARKVIAAQEAAVALVESNLVIGAVGGSDFNHLFHRPGGWRDNSLCKHVAATSMARVGYPTARLDQVDCLACLDAFTEMTRPKR